jgi:roadblock/LC7 domain-containing protein
MMRRPIFGLAIATALAGSMAASAQEHDHMSMPGMHAANAGEDHRQFVDFPAQMREHNLANMRAHLQALSEILAAMAAGHYADAGRIAEKRLGMDSPAAAGCTIDASSAGAQMSTPPSMEHAMALAMPEAMRKLGLEMHMAASSFAVEARKAAKTGNAQPALAALSRVTQRCTACHANYKVR